MAVTADAVKQLRERTGAGMMECKKALTETKGDIDKAIDFLRKQGLAKADKKAAKEAKEAKPAAAAVAAAPASASCSSTPTGGCAARSAASAAAAPGRCGSRHRSHWWPSTRWMCVVTPRSTGWGLVPAPLPTFSMV